MTTATDSHLASATTASSGVHWSSDEALRTEVIRDCLEGHSQVACRMIITQDELDRLWKMEEDLFELEDEMDSDEWQEMWNDSDWPDSCRTNKEEYDTLDGMDLRAVDFRGLDLQGATFKGCDFRGVDFTETDGVEPEMFINCDLEGAKF